MSRLRKYSEKKIFCKGVFLETAQKVRQIKLRIALNVRMDIVMKGWQQSFENFINNKHKIYLGKRERRHDGIN